MINFYFFNFLILLFFVDNDGLLSLLTVIGLDLVEVMNIYLIGILKKQDHRLI